MENLEQIRYGGRGSLDDLEDVYHETEDESFKRLFCSVPSLFLDAAISNPFCKLKSIEIDAGDSKRASSLLASIQSTLSVGYSKLEVLSLKFDRYEYCSDDSHTVHLLSESVQLTNAQPYLRSIDISIPGNFSSTGRDLERVEKYTEFIAAIKTYVHSQHFECLTLRNLLMIERAQQIVRTFLSLPLSSHQQLLDIRAPDDVTSQSDTVIDGPGKVLMISGSDVDGDGKECLTSLVFQMLCDAGVHHFEVVDNIDGMISALKQPIEGLITKSICLTIRKDSVPPTLLYFRSLWPRNRHWSSYQREHDRRAKVMEFQGIDKLVGNPSLLALTIRFQSGEDYLSSSQVSRFLSTISDGLQLQSCSLRSLTLPKLDYPFRNDYKLSHFFCCIFSLPHVEELELNLAFVKFPPQSAEIIHSRHRERGGKRLAKFNLQCDSIVGSDSEKPLKVLLNDICKELYLKVNE